MSRKRTLEFEDTQMSTGSPSQHSLKRGRPRTSNPNPPASDSLSINRLKSKIRDTTRLLNRAETISAGISAGVRIEKERALAGYQHDLAQAEEQAEKHKRRQLMIKKYHMVRFVERQKATRILKKINNRLEETEEGTEEYENLLAEVHNAEVDVNYTLFHPLDERYQGLYPRDQGGATLKDKKAATERSEKETVSKPRYWTVVEQCMQDGTLDALKEGKLARVPRNAKGKHRASTASRCGGKTPKTTSQTEKGKSITKTQPKEEKDESDGGFFEE